jgi:hypothetical protein
LAIIDEAEISKKQASIFKSLITDMHKIAEGKGKEARQILNYINFIFSCNAFLAPMDAGERRFFVLRVNPKYANDKGYFERFLTILADPNTMKMFAYYLTHDEYLIHGMEKTLRSRPPCTDFKKSLIAQNLKGYRAWWRDCIQARVNSRVPVDGKLKWESKFQNPVPIEDLLDHAREHRSIRSNREIHVTWFSLSLELEEMCWFKQGVVKQGQSEIPVVWFPEKPSVDKDGNVDNTNPVTDWDKIHAHWSSYLENANWRTPEYQEERKNKQEKKPMPRLPSPVPAQKRPRFNEYQRPRTPDADVFKLYSVSCSLADWNDGPQRGQPSKYYYAGNGSKPWYGSIKAWQCLDGTGLYAQYYFAGTHNLRERSPLEASEGSEVQDDSVRVCSSPEPESMADEEENVASVDWSSSGEADE